MPRRRAIVTRPQRDAQQWAQDLQAAGIEAVALPLIAIRGVRDPALHSAMLRARAECHNYRALMFVSGNAVHYFFEGFSAPALAATAQAAIHTRAWAPGPGTAQALRDAGVPAGRIDRPAPDAAQFDSESLWQQVAPQIGPGDRVLIVRGAAGPATEGGSGRDWLARQIAAAGGSVEFVAVYERAAPDLSPAQRTLAQQAATDGSVWLLSSSEAVTHLRAALPGQDWSGAHALATHPRIAGAARAAGFGTVTECRPAFDDVVASIESLHEL